jgi:hypothetical protein
MSEEVGYDVVKERKYQGKNSSSKHGVQCGAIQSEKNSRHEIIIKTDFISTIMAANNRTPTNNPKTQTTRKVLERC